jgi:hypothetical protein
MPIIGRWRRGKNDQGWPAKLAFPQQTDKKQRQGGADLVWRSAAR